MLTPHVIVHIGCKWGTWGADPRSACTIGTTKNSSNHADLYTLLTIGTVESGECAPRFVKCSEVSVLVRMHHGTSLAFHGRCTRTYLIVNTARLAVVPLFCPLSTCATLVC